MEAFINEITRQVHPDKELSGEALHHLRTIINYIFNSKGNNELFPWINSNIPGELKRHAISEARRAKPSQITINTFGKDLQWDAIIEYLVSEIIELAGNKIRELDSDSDSNEITEYHLFRGIYDDEELFVYLKDHIILFPFGFYNKYKKFKIPKNEYGNDMNYDFKAELLDLLTALVNYYSGSFSFDVLWDYQNKVKTLILNGLQVYNLDNLINFLYNGPGVKNIPWREVFLKAKGERYESAQANILV